MELFIFDPLIWIESNRIPTSEDTAGIVKFIKGIIRDKKTDPMR